MKSLLNITKETACYRGKEITHGIGYDAYILELNKLDKKFNKNNIIVAYEPIWSIGTGKIPKKNERI